MPTTSDRLRISFPARSCRGRHNANVGIIVLRDLHLTGVVQVGVPPGPAIDLPAVGAHEVSRPAKPLKVVEARYISREPGLELANGPGVVHPGPSVITLRRPLRLNGEPVSCLCRCRHKHDLKHTGVALLAAAGVDPMEIARRAGHLSVCVHRRPLRPFVPRSGRVGGNKTRCDPHGWSRPRDGR
jgi:hypothetical protein